MKRAFKQIAVWMGIVTSALAACSAFGQNKADSNSVDDALVLDYDQMILLDAENLAELGIKEAYDAMLPTLKQYVATPLVVEEMIDHGSGRYSVSAGGVHYHIYPIENGDESKSWEMASYALFDIVNRQLESSDYKFYAINGGNDLGGLFLTQQQYQDAIHSLSRKTDWPYLFRVRTH